MTNSDPSLRGRWPLGLAMALGCMVMVIPLAFLVGFIASLSEPEGVYLGLMVAAVFGLSQFVFVIPLGIWLHRRGKHDSALGLWITAGVGLLANGACFGLLGVF